MPTLENDSLVFRFPDIEENAQFSIDFQRTLRIPDSDRTYPLPPGLGAWDLEAMDRVFVTLIHAKDWKHITGESALNHPPTAQDYSRAGLPWFDYYGCDQTALPVGNTLSALSSIGSLFKEKTGAALPNSEDVETGIPMPVGARRVHIGEW